MDDSGCKSATASTTRMAGFINASKKFFHNSQVKRSGGQGPKGRLKLGELTKQTTIDDDDGEEIFPSPINTMSKVLDSTPKPLPNFVSVIEGTKNLSLTRGEKLRTDSHASKSFRRSESQKEQDLVAVGPGNVPIPTKCSSQLRKLLSAYSSGSFDSTDSSSSSAAPNRPIFPNLPFSPYGSPNASPRIKRKPLRETKRVSSISEDNGDYVQLNQYKLEENIGQGSYGIVKLAYNKEDDSHYALKIVSKKKLRRKAGLFGRGAPNRKTASGAVRKRSEDPIQKVYREIAIMKKLDHPNVTKLVEVLDDPEDENMYMVFELLERGEILVVPTDTPLSEEQAWLAFRDIVLGLEYLHFQKIIHRDIKPSNLLRADDGLVKIADLGVCNEFDGQDAFLTNTAGTPAFTPPESLAHKPGDEPFSGKAADIWSLGVTLYSLVYGKVPFHDENILALYNKILTQTLVFEDNPNVTVSEELKGIVSRMLIKDANERISLPEIKAHDWVTGYGIYPLLSEEENCTLVEVTDNEVKNSIHTVPKLDTLILVKSMIKNHSFSNPFNSLRSRFQSGGRSNSAPGAYDIYINTGGLSDSSLPKVVEKDHEED